jgi:hypothetical protein
VNFDKVVNCPDPIKCNNKHNLEEMISSMESGGKINYFLIWKGFLAEIIFNLMMDPRL